MTEQSIGLCLQGFESLFLHQFKMVVKVTPLGGFGGEVGRNCIAVDVDGKIIILDMGVHLERYIEVTQDDLAEKKHLFRKLSRAKAIPEARFFSLNKKNIVGACISHAHLDHVGAIPYIMKRLKCPLYATPFTCNVIRALAERTSVDCRPQDAGSTFFVAGISVEFIHVAHSTPQTVGIAIHTPNDGTVLYLNDYKNDTDPVFEKPTDVARLKDLSPSLLILDTLNAHLPGYAPSERAARDEVLALAPELDKKRAIVFSTFSSQLSRLRSALDLAKQLGREPVFVGRSLAKYVAAAKDFFPQDVKSLVYRRQIDSFLSKCRTPEKYFFMVTGHQGEPKAVLSRMADGLFQFTRDDAVIFSCRVIPTPLTREARAVLEQKLEEKGVSVYKDVHATGHAHAQDHKEVIEWLNPAMILPAHAESRGLEAFKSFVDKEKLVDIRLFETFSFSRT